MKKKSLSVLFGLMLAGGALAACGGDEDGDATATGGDSSEESSTSEAGSTTAPGDTGSGGAEASFNDADVTFAQNMIVHHQMAIDMAGLAETRAESTDVKELAMRIEEAQAPEIESMRGLLEEWGQPESGGDMDMGGMTEDQMADLEAAQGAEFDQMFLTMMIEHHGMAIDMAETEVEEGQNTEAVAMAEAIIQDQEAEIIEMEGLLETLGA